MLGVLLLSGWGTGFKTKMCDHDKTVDAIKKTYDCALEFGKEFLKKGGNPTDGGTVMMTALGEATQKCMAVVLGCVPADQFEKLMSSPMEVVETDNKCKMEQMLGVMGKVQTCAQDYGFKMDNKEKEEEEEEDKEDEEAEITAELCSKIGTGVEKCALDLKIDCFSKRENAVLSEIMGTAFGDVKELFAMDEVQKMVEKDMSANEKELAKCAMGSSGSGSGAGRLSGVFGVLFPLLTFLYVFYKF